MNRRIKYYDSILDNNSYLLSLALVYHTSILHDVSRNISVEFTSADVGPRGSKVSYRRGMGSAVCLITYNVSYIMHKASLFLIGDEMKKWKSSC